PDHLRTGDGVRSTWAFAVDNARGQGAANTATEKLAFGEVGCEASRTPYCMDEPTIVPHGLQRLDAVTQCDAFRFRLSRHHHQTSYALSPPLHALYLEMSAQKGPTPGRFERAIWTHRSPLR